MCNNNVNDSDLAQAYLGKYAEIGCKITHFLRDRQIILRKKHLFGYDSSISIRKMLYFHIIYVNLPQIMRPKATIYIQNHKTNHAN